MSGRCESLHNFCKSLTKFRYPFDTADFPRNGVYVMFEDGETAHGTDRIVRIGAHTGQNNLKQRLSEHFLKENKNRSVFRKNIGRALLHKANDEYLKVWNTDFTSGKNKEKYRDKFDGEKEREIERLVSEYIRKHISFAVFPVEDRELRLALETKMTGTVSLCEECGASAGWPGRSSPQYVIRNSGLWQEQGVAIPLADDDMKLLREITRT